MAAGKDEGEHLMARIRRLLLAEIPDHATESVRYLYIVAESGGYVKVGRARHPIWRLSDLQCGNWRTLVLAAVWAGERLEIKKLERRVHDDLSSLSARGEWFECTAETAIRSVERLVR